MENKVKQKLIRSLKELKIYKKLRQSSTFGIRINCINPYELINHYIINFVSKNDIQSLLNDFDVFNIISKIPTYIKIQAPTEYEELMLLSNFLDKNGILWVSGDKFSEFNAWEKRGGKVFELHNCSYISYSTSILPNSISVKDFIKLFDNIKEEVNKLYI